MVHIMAPVVPYLAEEIHHAVKGSGDKSVERSVFTKQWTPLVRDSDSVHILSYLLIVSYSPRNGRIPLLIGTWLNYSASTVPCCRCWRKYGRTSMFYLVMFCFVVHVDL